MDAVFHKPRLLRALTSLDLAEFVRLETGLAALLASERRERTHAGGARQRSFGAGGETSKLPTSRHKLLFILFYFKSYPTQEVRAFSSPSASHRSASGSSGSLLWLVRCWAASCSCPPGGPRT